MIASRRSSVRHEWIAVVLLLAGAACDDSGSPTATARVPDLAGAYTGSEFIEADYCLMRGGGPRTVEMVVEQSGDEVRLEGDLIEATGTVHEDGSVFLTGDLYGETSSAEVTISGFFRELGEVLLVKAWIDGLSGDAVCFARVSYELARIR